MKSVIIILLLLAAVAVNGNEEGENRLLEDDDYEGGWREAMGWWKCFRTIANGYDLLEEGIGSSGRK